MPINPEDEGSNLCVCNGLMVIEPFVLSNIPAQPAIHFRFPATSIVATQPGVNICVVVRADLNPANDTACKFIVM